jgi:hypothetical protein
MSREAALGELARRYLAGHAPAADRDLAQWAGIGLADARLGLARCGAIQRADRLAELPANPQRAAAALPPPRLLGAFEPLLLGWASRDPPGAAYDARVRPSPRRRHGVPALGAGGSIEPSNVVFAALAESSLAEDRTASRWRAVVPPGQIPGDGPRTTLGAWDLAGLMDQLDEIYPDGSER